VSVEVFSGLHADVGEAPHWDEQSMTLLFVDLTGGAVFRYDQFGVKLSSFSVGQEVGAAVPRRGGGLVLAVRDGIAVASDSGDGFELATPVERDTPGNRMNDAKCDSARRNRVSLSSRDSICPGRRSRGTFPRSTCGAAGPGCSNEATVHHDPDPTLARACSGLA
jgi:sugar lactone lactonase YvrE